MLICVFDGSWKKKTKKTKKQKKQQKNNNNKKTTTTTTTKKNKKKRRPRLFKRWLALSTGQISIQRIRFGKTDCVNHLIEIYPIDSVSQLLNNCGTGPGGLITCRYCEIIYGVSVCTVSSGVI